MQKQQTNRQWQRIEIPAKDFNNKLDQFSAIQTSPGTLFSRLALIHQVAKAYAVEAANQSGHVVTTLDIEEITDPPLYSYALDDEPIIIQFSY